MLKSLLALPVLTGLGLTPVAAPDPADIPAHHKAWQVFMVERVTCFDKIVMAVEVTPPRMSGFADVPGYKPLRSYTAYVEATGVAAGWSGNGARLTEADYRNGLEWQGTFRFVARAARELTVGKAGQQAAWSPWYSDVTIFTVELERRNRRWEARPRHAPGIMALGQLARVRAPACSEVPA